MNMLEIKLLILALIILSSNEFGAGNLKPCFKQFPTNIFNLQILAKHGSNDDIVGEQKFRSIKLILTVYFDLSVKSFSTGRTSAVGFLKFTMSCVVINILSQK